MARWFRPDHRVPPSEHAVPVEWSALPPTMMDGNLLHVVGESYHQEALEVIAGPKTPDGPSTTRMTAQLVLDQRNPVDPDAVAVFIALHHVGYVEAGLALEIGEVVETINESGRPATCRARVTGGWDRGADDTGSYGVVLEVADPARPRSSTDPVFAAARGRLNITGEEACQEFLRIRLGSGWRHVFTAVLQFEGSEVGVWYGSILVGRLTDKMSARYAPLVSHVAAEGWPLTCSARIKRGKKKLEVTLCLPQGDDLAYALRSIEPA